MFIIRRFAVWVSALTGAAVLAQSPPPKAVIAKDPRGRPNISRYWTHCYVYLCHGLTRLDHQME